MRLNKTLHLLIIAGTFCLAPHALQASEQASEYVDQAALDHAQQTAQEVIDSLIAGLECPTTSGPSLPGILSDDEVLERIAKQVAAVSLTEPLQPPPGLPIPTDEERERNSPGSTGSRRNDNNCIHHSPRPRAGTMMPGIATSCGVCTECTLGLVCQSVSAAPSDTSPSSKKSVQGSPRSDISPHASVPPTPHNSEASPVKKPSSFVSESATDYFADNEKEEDNDKQETCGTCLSCLAGESCTTYEVNPSVAAAAHTPRRSPLPKSPLNAIVPIPTPDHVITAEQIAAAQAQLAAGKTLDERLVAFAQSCWNTIRGCPRRTKALTYAQAESTYESLPPHGKAIADLVMAHSKVFQRVGIGITLALAVAAAKAYDDTACTEISGKACGQVGPWVGGIIAAVLGVVAYQHHNQDPIEEAD